MKRLMTLVLLCAVLVAALTSCKEDCSERGYSHDYEITPKYYGLKHYSRYILPGMIRVQTTSADDNLKFVAFKAKDEKTVTFVILCTAKASTEVAINIKNLSAAKSLRRIQSVDKSLYKELSTVSVDKTGVLSLTVPARSITTLTNIIKS